MRHFFKSFSLKDYLAFGIIAICNLVLLLQSYPISNDDFTYIFHQRTDLPITSFSELIDSNIWGYYNINGRFLVHCFVQGCLNNYIVFYSCSTLLFFVLMLSLTYLIRKSTNKIHGDIIYIITAITCFIPLMATLLYGTVAMTINYMWSAAIYTLFLSIYMHVKEDNVRYAWWQNILLVIFGLICGSWQESFCIGIAGALCIYHLINIRKLTPSLFCLLIGFGLGAAALVFAPGNFIRLSNEGSEWIGLSPFVYDFIQVLKHTGFIHAWWIIGVISVIVDIVKYRKIKFITDHWFWFLSASIAFAFSIYTISTGSYQGKWQFTILGIWAVILSLRFIEHYLYETLDKTYKYILPLLGCLVIGWYGFIIGNRSIVHREMDAFTHYFLTEKPDTIYDGSLQYLANNKVPNHEFVYEQICPMYIDFYNIEVLKNMAEFYTLGQESWGECILPEPIHKIAEQCHENGVAYLNSLGYVVVRYSKDEIPIDKALRIHHKSKYPIAKLKDMLKNRRGKLFECDLLDLYSLSDNEFTYYIKRIDWWHFHDRCITEVSVVDE